MEAAESDVDSQISDYELPEVQMHSNIKPSEASAFTASLNQNKLEEAARGVNMKKAVMQMRGALRKVRGDCG